MRVTKFLCIQFAVGLLVACGGGSVEPPQSTSSIKAAQPPAPVDPKVRCIEQRATMIQQSEAEMQAKRYTLAFRAVAECARVLADPELERLERDAKVAYNLSLLQDPAQSLHIRKGALEYLESAAPSVLRSTGYTRGRLEQAERSRAAAVKAQKRREGVSVGMSAQDVLDSSWGRPERVNRTVYTHGVHEQWVYGPGNYLYFEDGRLVTVQTSR